MEVAYGIVASLVLLLAVVFMFLQCCVKTPSQPIAERGRQLSFRDVWRPSVWADGDSCYGIVITVFVSTYFVLLMGAMIGTQVYLVTYATDSGMLTNQKAALLNSLTFGAGRVHVCKYIRSFVQFFFVLVPFLILYDSITAFLHWLRNRV